MIDIYMTDARFHVDEPKAVLDLAFFIGKEQQELWKRDGRSADFF